MNAVSIPQAVSAVATAQEGIAFIVSGVVLFQYRKR